MQATIERIALHCIRLKSLNFLEQKHQLEESSEFFNCDFWALIFLHHCNLSKVTVMQVAADKLAEGARDYRRYLRAIAIITVDPPSPGLVGSSASIVFRLLAAANSHNNEINPIASSPVQSNQMLRLCDCNCFDFGVCVCVCRLRTANSQGSKV